MIIKEQIINIICIGFAIIYFLSTILLIDKCDGYKKEIANLENKLNQYENVDVPSIGEIDSLKVNISYKDSIIKQIKIEYIKDVEWVKNMPDSAAVTLFHQLVWAESNADR